MGSFLNVVIVRLPAGRSIVTPRSACPSCRKPIAWFDNLPLLSYALLRARCRGCGARISARYPLVEALTASLFVAALAAGPADAGLLAARLAVVAALVAITFIDFDHRIVPDEISKPMIVLGPVVSFLVPSLQTGSWLAGPGAPPDRGGAILASLAGAAIGAAVLYAVRAAGTVAFRKAAARQGGEAMGLGDVKLLAGLGAWTGGQGAVLVFLAAAALGAAFGVGQIARVAAVARRRRRARGARLRHRALEAARRFGSAIPFAPFLSAGGVAALLVRERAIGWFLSWMPRG